MKLAASGTFSPPTTAKHLLLLLLLLLLTAAAATSWVKAKLTTSLCKASDGTSGGAVHTYFR